MSDVTSQEREFGLAGHPDGDLSGGAVAASGEVTMEVVPAKPKASAVFDQDDYEGGEGADLDEDA